MSGHTPGPWVVDEYGDVQANGEDVARIATGDHHSSADARLIAAAPELLELAKKYASECGECDGLGYVVNYVDPFKRGDASSPEMLLCDFCADIRTVIAKATGATP